MNMIIFGATGTIGRHLVKQALEKKIKVTAFGRNAKALSDLEDKNLRFYQGDVLDPQCVKEALIGQDIVLCALGAGKRGGLRAPGTQNIVNNMMEMGIQRFICLTTLGCGESVKNLNFIWKNIMFGWLLKDAYQDHEQQEAFVRRSSLDWTIIRPAAFTDGPLTGVYKHSFSEHEKGISLKISKNDIAHFALSNLIANERNLRKALSISY
ncbi:MAG TPA: NAD(P)-binding oxidoreductase [Sphingobacteriaceae bacterium]